MPTLPRISDAEWQVMNILWRQSPLTANQVVDQLAGHSGWNPHTVKTMLNRLVGKGALKFRLDGKRYLYTPAIARELCLRTESRGFANRLFAGRVAPLLAHFIESAKLSPAEIDELRKLLDQKGR